MLQHQDQVVNSAFGGDGSPAAASLQNKKINKDSNFNFLSGKDDGGGVTGGRDENRNQARPRNLGPMGRDPSGPSPANHGNLVSSRPRMPCWSSLEPLPEVECGDDGFGRVPPDGAEERRTGEEEGRAAGRSLSEEKLREKRRSGSGGFRGREEPDEDDDEWGDSESDGELSARSGGSVSSLNMDNMEEESPLRDRVGVGEPRFSFQNHEPPRNPGREPAARQRRLGRRSLTGSHLGNVREEGGEERGDQSSDSDGEEPELMDGVWTLRDRERFKAQEMEKHQVQLTMYRRLALIRWVRTLQARVLEQQNRLQSSFDVILTQRKELLRMGAAAAAQS